MSPAPTISHVSTRTPSSTAGSEYMSNGAIRGEGIYMGRTLSASLSYTRDVHRPVMRSKPGSTKAFAATPASAARHDAANRGIIAAFSRLFARSTSKASGAAVSNTAANATSAAPSSTVGGSPSTQGIAPGGNGGHGNSVNSPAVNATEAPAIVAVCEVIDR